MSVVFELGGKPTIQLQFLRETEKFSSVVLETAGGDVTKLTEHDTTFLTKKGQILITCAGNQPGVLIQVFGGERVMTKDSNHLSKLHLDGILTTPRGAPDVDATFDI